MNAGRQNVLILGATGMLGSTLLSGGYLESHCCLGHGRSGQADIQADLLDIKQVQKIFDRVRPDAIINLVGLTNVDHCEQSPNQAYRVNVHSLENVLTVVQSLPKKPRLVHVSTDQVYDGSGPHSEGIVALTNYYAFSKYMAELVATNYGALVLRTNFFGRSRASKRESITDWLYRGLKEGKEVQVFDDVLFSPLSMQTLCELIERSITGDFRGVFNLGSHEGASKAEFAIQFATMIGLPTLNLRRVLTSDVTFLKTYRPKDMRMDVSAIERQLGIEMPCLKNEIQRVAQEYMA